MHSSSCGACKNKAENACSSGGFVGLSGNGGGMSEEVVVPEVSKKLGKAVAECEQIRI